MKWNRNMLDYTTFFVNVSPECNKHSNLKFRREPRGSLATKSLVFKSTSLDSFFKETKSCHPLEYASSKPRLLPVSQYKVGPTVPLSTFGGREKWWYTLGTTKERWVKLGCSVEKGSLYSGDVRTQMACGSEVLSRTCSLKKAGDSSIWGHQGRPLR